MTERRLPHYCHAKGCDRTVPPAMFMCRVHWYTLPKATRDAVWLVYVPGQEERMDPSPEYLAVTQGAIDWLAAKEGK